MAEITVPVGGTSCRGCIRRLTRRLRDVAGVQTVSVDAGGRRVRLTGTMAESDVRCAVEDAGYGAQPPESEPGRVRRRGRRTATYVSGEGRA